MTAKVSYRKSRRDWETETWIVSCFDDPSDIMLYDKHTMNRLDKLFYKGSKAKDKSITVIDILEKLDLGKSNQTLDEYKGPDSSGH
tara:strand:+ start:111 stop:368 length:258 start_codon:yes stop_codon:yes gene_type:complete